MSERKLREGATERFVWQAPDSLFPASAGGTDPVLTVRLPSGDRTFSMTQLGGNFSVVGIADDRRTITLDNGGSAAPVGGVYGEPNGVAYIMQAGRDAIRVVVERRMTEWTIGLAEPMSGLVAEIISDQIQWATWIVELGPSDVTAAVQRNIPWTVAYTPARSGTIIPTARDEGVLHVVRQPFATGLADGHLYALVPGFTKVLPRSQASWVMQRDLAESVLVSRLRTLLKERDLWEDDLYGGALRTPHALLTAAYVLRGQAGLGAERQELADGWQQMAFDLTDEVMQRPPWIDSSRDGVIDSGEVGDQVAGPRKTAASGWSFDADASTTRSFTKGMGH